MPHHPPSLHRDELLRRRGRLVATLRTQHGWSQAHLSNLIGCDQSTISDCERGEHDISLTLLIPIAGQLGVPVETLLVGASPEVPA